MLLTLRGTSSIRAGSHRVTTAAAAAAKRTAVVAYARRRWMATMATPTPTPDANAAAAPQPPAVAAAAHAEGATSDAAPAAADTATATANQNKRKKNRGPKPPPPPGGRRPPCQDPDAIRTIADNKGSPFYELGLAIAGAGQGRTRVRQHVNPLRAEFNTPPPPPDWRKLYSDPTRPLVIDVGCGQGRFLLLLARRMRELRAAQEEKQKAAGGDKEEAKQDDGTKPSPAVLLPLIDGDATTTTIPQPCNYLGIEIREPLVERANRWVEMLGMQGEVAFSFGNATTALPSGFLDGYPGPLAACLVQFPDPHFKRKHHKRRVLQPGLAQFLRDRIAPGGCVFLQSDIYAAAAAMRDAMEEWGGGKGSFELAPQHFAGEGATFPDVGPPPEQVRPVDGGGNSKKQKKMGEGGAAAEAAGGDEGDADANDDEDKDQSAPSTFVSEWSREGGWLTDNPIGVPTEREHYVAAGGGSVFRVLLRRKRDEKAT